MEDTGPIIHSLQDRADIVRPARLQGFSDAVFATAATLLVIPIRKFELEGDETLKEALLKRWPQLAVFVVGFLVICAVWESHNIRFKLISKVDDFIVFLTLLSLMLTTFLPFNVALEGHFGKYKVSIILTCMTLLGLEIVELIIFIYAFHTPKLLSQKFKLLEPRVKKVKQRQIYIKVIINCILFLLAALFSVSSFVVSWILICIVIITPFLRRLIVTCTSLCTCCVALLDDSDYEVVTGRIDKERIETFSDAATAIVATLLILDLTTEDFPKTSEVEKVGLFKKISEMWQMFVAYIGTYVTVGILWFIHHSVLQHIKVFTAIMVIFNNIFLAFLAGTPFISTLVNKYTSHGSHNENIAVRVSCVIIFMASVMHVVIYTCALWQKGCLYSWAVPNYRLSRTPKSHWYLMFKTLIVPVVSLVTFLSCLGSNYTSFVIYHVALFAVPILFLILKIIYACHCWQQSNVSIESTSIRSSSSDLSLHDATAGSFHSSPIMENMVVQSPTCSAMENVDGQAGDSETDKELPKTSLLTLSQEFSENKSKSVSSGKNKL